jgi:hypothetical protein
MQGPVDTGPLLPALLQLLGWVGFLGVGYFVRGRIAIAVIMLIGWWTLFWVLLGFGVLTAGLGHLLMICVWLAVPPMTAAFLYFER